MSFEYENFLTPIDWNVVDLLASIIKTSIFNSNCSSAIFCRIIDPIDSIPDEEIKTDETPKIEEPEPVSFFKLVSHAITSDVALLVNTFRKFMHPFHCFSIRMRRLAIEYALCLVLLEQ